MAVSAMRSCGSARVMASLRRWSVSDRLAELALAVLPEVRGQGGGSALLDAVEARLRDLGVHDMVIAVVTNNRDAMRLYERRGAVPFVTQFIHRLDADND